MDKKMQEQIATIAGTYARAFITGVVTAMAIGKSSPSDLAKAGIAAVIPVLMRWANPKDTFPKKK